MMRVRILAAAILGLGLATGIPSGLWQESAMAQDEPEETTGEPEEAAKPAAKKKARLVYSHKNHERRKVKHARCSSCHILDDKYRAGPATKGKNHQPCARSNCHFKDFFAKEPRICVVCHDGSEPWLKQKAVMKPRPRKEFAGSGLSHKTHVELVAKKNKNAACKRCHGNKFKGQDKPATGGHSACAPCHGNNAKPAMNDCGSCHKMAGKGARRAKSSDWSVRARFNHATHGRDPRKSKETQCVLCHKRVAKATTLAEIKPPKMRNCDACHDGKHAFKTTGFFCHKCHGRTSNE